MSNGNNQNIENKTNTKSEESNNFIDFRLSNNVPDSIYEKRRNERLTFCRDFLKVIKNTKPQRN